MFTHLFQGSKWNLIYGRNKFATESNRRLVSGNVLLSIGVLSESELLEVSSLPIPRDPPTPTDDQKDGFPCGRTLVGDAFPFDFRTSKKRVAHPKNGVFGAKYWYSGSYLETNLEGIFTSIFADR